MTLVDWIGYVYYSRYAYSESYGKVTPAIVSLDHMEELTRLEIIHLVDVSLGELEFQLSKGRRSLVAAEKKAYFRTMTGFLLYWVSLLLNVINGRLQQLYLKIKEVKEIKIWAYFRQKLGVWFLCIYIFISKKFMPTQD